MACGPTKCLRCATSKLRALLAALWAGQLLCVALMAAPNAFATLARPEAGAYVARLFKVDAYVSMALSLVLILIEQRLQRDHHEGRVQFNGMLMLPLAALFCTVLGQEVLQPLISQAKTGQGAASFALLHGASLALFAAKGLAVLALAWRAISASGSTGAVSRA